MRNPLPDICREGLRIIVLVSLIVLLRRLLVPTVFCIIILHHCSFSGTIFILVSRILFRDRCVRGILHSESTR